MTPNYYTEKRYDNFREIINDSAIRFANRTIFRLKESEGKYRNITFARLKDLYYGLCTLLIKKGMLGKRIAVVGANSFQWSLAYLCASTVGVVVPIDKELMPEDVNDFLNAADCVAVFSDNKKLDALKKVATREIEYISFDDVEK